jgi:hypothetical protein
MIYGPACAKKPQARIQANSTFASNNPQVCITPGIIAWSAILVQRYFD